MKLRRSLWLGVFEFFLFFLIGFPLAVQVAELFFILENPSLNIFKL
ncbi:hypothetical protein [Caldicellulosiruptor owensensis]|nr:hypothetical protein [Caldicellulosiruptor owensensis]